jgi:DNA-3-methyladenine glycosylase
VSELLNPDWFARDTETVARELLGKLLCRKLPDGKVNRLVINETEAYVGPHDAACHAHMNRFTKRTSVMFADPGRLYIYLIYGIYHMLNIVTDREGYPAAVLIRGAGGLDGPGKLTRDLQIDKSFNNQFMSVNSGLWIEDAPVIDEQKIISTPRIGINYAGEPWVSAPLRFVFNKNS